MPMDTTPLSPRCFPMRIALILVLALTACDASDLTTAAVGSGTLDPVAYFNGRAEGRAQLHKLIGGSETILVHSTGRTDSKGGVYLDQRIEEEGKTSRIRHWHLVPAGPGRLTGTLTDANGPVEARYAEGRLDISYPMKGGLKATQVLLLRADGKTIDNRLTVNKLGIQLARLEEVITKIR